jgi:5-formyltetrahydrofolate cyclo-ligase
MDPENTERTPVLPPRSAGELRSWRSQVRTRFIVERSALAPSAHTAAGVSIFERITFAAPQIWTQTVGLYWPMKGEIELAAIAERIRRAGGRTALPVVVRRNSPLEFHLWDADAILTRDACGIPCPLRGIAVIPDVLLVPVIGFDNACYRLGYGGGYYDRTLAPLLRRPLMIGIGFELGHLGTIFPQPFDIPLDFILTEQTVHARPQD